MENTDIKYRLSRDYNLLYELINDNKLVIVGFVATTYKNQISLKYSKLCLLHYQDAGIFDFGEVAFLKSDFGKDRFIKICEEYNIQFFELN